MFCICSNFYTFELCSFYCTIFLKTDKNFFSLATVVVAVAFAVVVAGVVDFVDNLAAVFAAASSSRVCAAIRCSKTNAAEGIIIKSRYLIELIK